MSNVIRVALPGYNAMTDTDPDHYALYADEDWVLIKEAMRGSISVGATDTETITHNLGYVPFWGVYAQDSEAHWVYGVNFYGDFRAYSDTTTLTLQNDTGTARTFYYYIFHDQQI